jgi:Uncharacterised nucleotidyltransferase
MQLLGVFEAHGIGTIPYKGPSLASCAPGNLALRQFGDLDLLLRKQDIPAARGLLIARGYRVAFALTPTYEAVYLQSSCELHFVHDRSGIFVELHSALSPRDFPFPLHWEELRGRLVSTSIGGREVRTLAPEDLHSVRPTQSPVVADPVPHYPAGSRVRARGNGGGPGARPAKSRQRGCRGQR